jgi:glycosyltransferase involved in cell wall biosynthesis
VIKPRLLYVVTEDWYFLSHRLPMARAARDVGFEVHVAAKLGSEEAGIRAEGFIPHHVPFARGRASPIATLRTLRALRAVYASVRPTISHHVSLQPTVLASLAALDRDVVCINALTGFGFAFTSSSPKARALKPLLGNMLRLLIDRGGNVALVQNPDDHATLCALGIPPQRIVTIAGSGVDLARFAATPEPAEPVVVGYAGRLLEDKGIHTLVEAHRLLLARGRELVLEVAGEPDAANPSSISPETLVAWRREPRIRLRGHVRDVSRFWPAVHIAVLPSRREGLPKSLIEAAACARPMISCDVPGCREVVVRGKTGMLVPVDDPQALADALEELAGSRELRLRFGAEARRLAEERFGADLIASQIAALYTSLSAALGRDAA